jgi:conjugal transfer/type IV secretion protein DotA/TraY
MKQWIFLALFAMGVLCPEFAFAADIFTPSSNDISMKILAQIFGGLVTGGGVDAFGDGMAAYTGAVLSVGGILAAYTILAGTIGTAHDGEMLGKKFSSVWIPIRYCIGTALVLPIMNGGYCLMQVLVMWIITQGVGLADKIWDGYRKTPNVSADYKLSTSAKQQIIKLSEDAFIASSCVAAHAQYINDTPSILSMLDRYDYRIAVDGDTYNYGDQKGVMSYVNNNMCGWVKLPANVANQSSATGAASNGTGKLGDFGNLFQAQDLSSIGIAQQVQTKILIQKMTALGQKTVANRTDVPKNAKAYYAEVNAAANEYMNGVTAAAQAVVKGKGVPESNGYGWFLAGSYFTNDIVANDRINNAVNSVSTSGSSLDTARTTSTDADVDKYMVANQVVSARGAQYATRITADGKKPDDAHRDAEFSIGGKIAAMFTDQLTGIDLYSLKNDPRHPIIASAGMGSSLINLWGGAALAMSALSLGASVPGFGGGVASFLNVIMGFLMLPISALSGCGFMLTYLIPMMPFILFLGAAAGFITECIIAILAAPLWAIMHLHPSGDDMHGKGGNGYSLVLELLLRPAMLVFGLMAGIVFSGLIGEFVNKVFFQVFSLSAGMGNGITGFFMVIAGTVIYAYIMFGVMTKSFSLIHVIPDTLLRWIGGGGGSIGQAASQMAEGAKGGFVAAAAVVSRSGGLDFSKGRNGGNDKKMPDGDGSAGVDKTRKSLPGGSGSENGEGGSSLGEMSAKKQFDSKIDDLGGKDSPKAQAFAKNLDEERKVNPDKSSNEQMDTAMKSTLNQEFGTGSGAMIKGFAGGTFSGSKFKEAVGMYEKAKHGMKASGITDKKEIANKLKEATVTARNAFTADKKSKFNGGEKPLGHYLSGELSKFREIDKLE